ncbi:MAG: hypothetical protein ABW034_22620 [Steroidobacteraceae bacterium]
MVAAHNEFLVSVNQPPFDEERVFVGEWLLDRVSGLVDCATVATQRLRIDARMLHIELKRNVHSSAFSLTVELNGEAVEFAAGDDKYSAQALFEADALIWEIEHESARGIERIRRVMRSSTQGSQLIAERVDMNPEGVPIALRTEFWARAGRLGTVRDAGSIMGP